MTDIPKSIALVIGHPVAHSKSPIIHNHWLMLAQIKAQYRTLDVAPEQLRKFIQDFRNNKYIGANVTLPHKQNILSFCDTITPMAEQIGAVNTLYFADGKLVGDNTDAYGFMANLDQYAPQWDKNLSQAIVLGAGGAARAIIAALILRKTDNIIILNRTMSNAQNLADWFSKTTKSTQLTARRIKDFHQFANQTDLLVNTSSVGLNNTRFQNLDLAALPAHTLVHDIVYTPLLTPLLADAEKRGLKTVDGLGMLLHQAAPGFKKWFGVFPPINDELRQIVLKSLQNEITN